ncbi:ariadne-2 protein [Venturia nashicola]|uniref:Ariadne-2 protein n=1 Tax=Venturia nashicola TaxID=86259 RepID=A0A4Z1NFA4_9PEZI|nr:ariadne-2 protein [Venturia nashicola]
MFSAEKCKFFHLPGASQCREGKSCHYNTGASSTSPRQWVHNPLPEKYVRALRGAIVSFNHGAEVCKVSPLDGWSAVRIDGFPEATTCSDVLRLLDMIGSDLNEAGGAWIIMMLVPGSAEMMRSARVIVENSDYSNWICNKLTARGVVHHKFNATTEIMPTTNLAGILNDPTSRHKHIHRLTYVGECVICCDEAVVVMRTECGLQFCRGCWVQMCKEESKSKGFMACCGENCSTKFSFQDVQNLDWLDSTAFDSILENSLRVYVRQNPKALIECPGAKCGQLYNREGHGAITCRRVNTCGTPRFCTTCEDPHPGVICETYASDVDGSKAALEAYMKETNTKRCPHCWEAVQLKEACNHMTCRCGQHWCFRCRALFETAPEVYQHMVDEHGTQYGEVDVAPGEQPFFGDVGVDPLGVWIPPMVLVEERVEAPMANPLPMARGRLRPDHRPQVPRRDNAHLPPLEFFRPGVQPMLARRFAQAEPEPMANPLHTARGRLQPDHRPQVPWRDNAHLPLEFFRPGVQPILARRFAQEEPEPMANPLHTARGRLQPDHRPQVPWRDNAHPPPLDFLRPRVQPMPARRFAQEETEPVEVARLREQARLAARRATMQGHLAEARAEVGRAERQQADNAFVRLDVRRARNAPAEIDDRTHRMERDGGLPEADAILEAHLQRRRQIHRVADDARQRLEAFQDNRELAQQPREEVDRQQTLADLRRRMAIDGDHSDDDQERDGRRRRLADIRHRWGHDDPMEGVQEDFPPPRRRAPYQLPRPNVEVRNAALGLRQQYNVQNGLAQNEIPMPLLLAELNDQVEQAQAVLDQQAREPQQGVDGEQRRHLRQLREQIDRLNQLDFDVNERR